MAKIDDACSLGIYIEQKEIGLYGSYEISEVPIFNINDLEFKLLEYQNKVIVHKLQYQNNPIGLKKKDTVIIYQNGFIID